MPQQDQLNSIRLTTYVSPEKSNRFWFFIADGSSGEWRCFLAGATCSSG